MSIEKTIRVLGHIALGYALVNVPIMYWLLSAENQMWNERRIELSRCLTLITLFTPIIGGVFAVVLLIFALRRRLWGTCIEGILALLIEVEVLYIVVCLLALSHI